MITMLSSRVARQPQVVEQLLPGEAVLLVPTRGEVKVLNDVGARIWMAVDGTRTVAQIAALICAEYAVDQGQAERDALQFVQELVARDLVVLRS